MRPVNIVKMAIKSVASNKIRTFLTMLGIIIGVLSVLVLVAVSEGSSKAVLSRMEGLGSNMINIYVYKASDKLKYEDVEGMQALEGVDRVSPVITSYASVRHMRESKKMKVEGSNSSYAGINDYTVASGRNISPIDVDMRNKVAVIGSRTAELLFGGDDPLSKEISIDGVKHTVIGVFRQRENTAYGELNEIVVIPYSTAVRASGNKEITKVIANAQSAEVSKLAADNMKSYLRDYFDDEDSYGVYSQDEMLGAIEDNSRMMTTMMAGIAGISLIVGGIGIMNIMLVTVTERTREIGIRKAIGAGRGSIMLQFVTESAVISSMGGVLGIILGIFVSQLICSRMSIPCDINVTLVAVAFGFSVVTGIFFGMYPAGKASKLKPVDALTFE